VNSQSLNFQSITPSADGLKSQNKPWPHPSAKPPKMSLPGHIRAGFKKVTEITEKVFD